MSYNYGRLLILIIFQYLMIDGNSYIVAGTINNKMLLNISNVIIRIIKSS